MPQYAVIDLGTNGFRLQIAEPTEGGELQFIHKESIEFKLMAESIERIGEASFARGLAIMRHFAEVLQAHPIQKLLAMGTAGLRLTANGMEFMETVKRETGIEIELISGDREAALIYKGMLCSLPAPLLERPILMVDIGGGSVEFIIGTRREMLWAQSFNVGVAVLWHNFQQNDPLTEGDITAVKTFLNQTLQPFLEAMRFYSPASWAVASGTTDEFVRILLNDAPAPPHYPMSTNVFYEFYNDLIIKNLDELKTSKMHPSKLEMLGVTLVLTDFIAELFVGSPFIHISKYSMKQGILQELAFGV